MSEDAIAVASEEPKVEELINEFKACAPMNGGGWSRVTVNDEVRHAIWPGQSPDGKKRDVVLAQFGQKAFPYDGASDTRIMMADEIVTEQTAELVVAFWRAAMQPKMSMDAERGFVLKLMDHLMNKVMADELMDQVELAAQYRGTYGWFALHPRWARQISLERREVTMDELKQVMAKLATMQMVNAPENREAQAMVQRLAIEAAAKFEQQVMNPAMDKETAAMLQQLHQMYAAGVVAGERIELPPLQNSSLRRAVKALRETGRAELPVPYICRDEPEILTLKPWDEIFLHSDVVNSRQARWFYRVCMTEVELKEKIVTDEWDKKWVEEALKHKGKSSEWGANGLTGSTYDPTKFEDRGYTSYTCRDHKNGLVEVLYCIYLASDEDNVPGVYCTVLHPEVTGLYAKHGLTRDLSVPMYVGRREKIAPQLVASRGVPEVVLGWQREKKALRDSTVDLASIGVLPPINKYSSGMQAQYRFGPGVQNTVQAGREPKFMDIPTKGAPLAFEGQDRIDHDVRWYFKRYHGDVPAVLSQVMSQFNANSFLGVWMQAFSHVLQLYRMNGNDAEFARVTGAPEGWFDAHKTNKELWGAELNFDIRELDPEFVMKQLEVMNTVVLPSDTTGAVNRRGYTQFQLQAVNPILARTLIKDQTEASQQMFDEVQNQMMLMYAGNIPKMVENDPAAGTKLQYAQMILEKNPKYQKAMAEDPRFAKLLEVFQKNLQFSLAQQRNKQIGRIGVDPEAVAE